MSLNTIQSSDIINAKILAVNSNTQAFNVNIDGAVTSSIPSRRVFTFNPKLVATSTTDIFHSETQQPLLANYSNLEHERSNACFSVSTLGGFDLVKLHMVLRNDNNGSQLNDNNCFKIAQGGSLVLGKLRYEIYPGYVFDRTCSVQMTPTAAVSDTLLTQLARLVIGHDRLVVIHWSADYPDSYIHSVFIDTEIPLVLA